MDETRITGSMSNQKLQIMRKVDKITKYAKGDYDHETKQYLLNNFGCDGIRANFIVEGEYPKHLVEGIAKYISKFHGKLNVYKLWFAKEINSWRLVLGYP